MTDEVVAGSPEKIVRVGTVGLACASEKVTAEMGISVWTGEGGRAEVAILVLLVTSEVAKTVLSGEIIVVGTDKLPFAPGLVATEEVKSESLWGIAGAVLETDVQVSVE